MRRMFAPRLEWNSATWARKDKRMSGRWMYNWAQDCFVVEYGRQNRRVTVYADTPEWCGWKLEDKS